MKLPADRLDDRAWTVLLGIAVVAMLPAALYRLPLDLWDLAFAPMREGAAMDLRARFTEVRAWFGGAPVYGGIESADYPPASYLMLAPFLRWRFPTSRIVWAAATLVATVALVLLVLRAGKARTWVERAFLTLLPLSLYAASSTVRLGQTGMLVLACATGGTLLLARAPRTWQRTAAAALLFVPALIKPSLAAPLALVPLFVGGWVALAVMAGGYAVLTLAAAEFQRPTLTALITGWLGQRQHIDPAETHASLHTLLAVAGFGDWLLAASLLVLAALALWMWHHRDRDPWLLLGVAAIVARFWTSHRWYDDVLMVLPMLALFRLAAHDNPRRAAPVILLLLVLALGIQLGALRGTGRLGPAMWGAKTVAWLAALAYLGWRARAPAPAPAAP